jgi:hypothetical protein
MVSVCPAQDDLGMRHPVAGQKYRPAASSLQPVLCRYSSIACATRVILVHYQSPWVRHRDCFKAPKESETVTNVSSSRGLRRVTPCELC